MAKKKYKQGPTGVSFAGAWVFPKITEVDYGTDEFPKHAGEFSIQLKGKLTDPKVKEFIAELQPMHDAAIAKAKEAFKALKPDVRKKLEKVTVNPLYKELYEDDNETPTGEVLFSFKMPYSGEYKSGPKEGETWYRTPQIFDARGNNLKVWTVRKGQEPKRNVNVPDIYGGTVGRVSYEVGLDKDGEPGYFIPATGAAGLSLRLRAARVLDLVTAGERSASDYGFDAEEEGYTLAPSEDADADDTAEATTEAADTSSTDSDDTDF